MTLSILIPITRNTNATLTRNHLRCHRAYRPPIRSPPSPIPLLHREHIPNRQLQVRSSSVLPSLHAGIHAIHAFPPILDRRQAIRRRESRVLPPPHRHEPLSRGTVRSLRPHGLFCLYPVRASFLRRGRVPCSQALVKRFPRPLVFCILLHCIQLGRGVCLCWSWCKPHKGVLECPGRRGD
jgi:hypothetical protein